MCRGNDAIGDLLNVKTTADMLRGWLLNMCPKLTDRGQQLEYNHWHRVWLYLKHPTAMSYNLINTNNGYIHIIERIYRNMQEQPTPTVQVKVRAYVRRDTEVLTSKVIPLSTRPYLHNYQSFYFNVNNFVFRRH